MNENKQTEPVKIETVQLDEAKRLRVIERFPEVFDRLDGVNVDAVMGELHDFIEVTDRYHWFISRCTEGMSHGRLYMEDSLEAQVQEAETRLCKTNLEDFLSDLYDAGGSIVGEPEDIDAILTSYDVELPKEVSHE